MAGYGLPNEQHLSVVLQNNLSLEGHNIEIINGSVSGSTSAGGLNIAEWTLSEPGIDLMILCLGANDMLRGINPKETKNNLEEIIKIAKSKNIKVIIAGAGGAAQLSRCGHGGSQLHWSAAWGQVRLVSCPPGEEKVQQRLL